MGQSDFYASGDWNAVCFECGRKFKASMLRKHWQGYYVCPDHWEPRHPQDFATGITDNQTPPWAQPMPSDTFAARCTPNGMSAVPGYAQPGCMVPGWVSPMFDASVTA